MEPLVVFGAGLVIYCGYLAVMDEVRDLKRCLARYRASSESRQTRTARKPARPDAAKGRVPAANLAYHRGGRLLASHAR